MLLGLVLALMMGIAVFAVLWPLSRSRTTRAASSDVAVYRAQLDEIERDRATGAIAAADAEAARVEVSRRLLGAVESPSVAPPDLSSNLFRRRATAVAALVLMPLSAVVLYLALGSPALPGQPRAARVLEQEQQSLDAMIARVESHLENNPDDGRGWDVIAPVYMRLGRFDDAVRAGRNVLRTLGETPERQANLAEALVMQANGVVTAEAKTLFEHASTDPDNARAHFYLGLAAEQDGRPADAAQIWRALIARAPADAPWLAPVRQALTRVDGASPAPGPNADDVAAAADMAPAEREQMVHAMVDRLAARLHEDGSDVEGWLRLMRAHMMLGDRDKARAAAADARRALKDTPDKLRRLDDGAKAFGLDG